MTRGKLIRIVVSCVLVALGAFLLTSLATHDPHQGPFPDYPGATYGGNACGLRGAYVSGIALALMGWAAYLPAVAVVLAGLAVLFKPQIPDLPIRLGGFVLFTGGVVLGLAILNSSAASAPGYYRAAPGTAGGVLGILLADRLYLNVGAIGAWILFLLSCVVGALLLAGPELVVLYHLASPLVRRALGKGPAAPAPAGAPAAPEVEAALPDAEPDEGLVLLAQDEIADDEEAPVPEEAVEAEAPEEAPKEAPPEPELIGPVAPTAGDEEPPGDEDEE